MKNKDLKRFAPILILFPSSILAFMDKPAEMGLSIAAGMLFCIFLNIEMFSKFQGPGGIGAELRERIKEADITIEKMKKLMKPIVLYTYTELTYGKLVMGIPKEKEKQITESMAFISKELSIETDEEIKEAKENYIKYHVWLMYGEFLTSLICEGKYQNAEEELQALRDSKTTNYPDREKIMEIINKHEITLDDRRNKLLNDYFKALMDNFNK